MKTYEYKVVPAPKKGEKTKGAKTTASRFAHALSELMNTMGAEGWAYFRAETLPCEERAGLTGTKTSFQNILVFQREIPAKPAVKPAHKAPEIVVPPPVPVPTPAPVMASTGDSEPTRIEVLPKRSLSTVQSPD